MATRSQTVSTSPSSCDENKTVLPSSFSRWMISRTFIRPTGSRPLVGSSRMSRSGIVDERLRQTDALLHAFGISFDEPFARVFQVHQFQHGINACSRCALGILKMRA